MSISDMKGRPGARPAEEPVKSKTASTFPRRARLDPEQTIGIPRAEMTPTVQSEVTRLIDEVDRLKNELTLSQQRVVELETVVDEDPLVPVLNRRGFMRELERTIAYMKRYETDLALIYIDLDDFKDVNDTKGHAAGDEVLRHVAKMITKHVRQSDVVGRLGGDEFAIVLHKAGLSIAEMKARQLADSVAATPLEFEGQKIQVSISVGSAPIRPEDGPAEALERADKAMYAQKYARKALSAE